MRITHQMYLHTKKNLNKIPIFINDLQTVFLIYYFSDRKLKRQEKVDGLMLIFGKIWTIIFKKVEKEY